MSQDSTEKKEGANGGDATTTMAASSNDKSPVSSTTMDDNNQKERNVLLNRRKAIRVLEHRKILLERMQLCQKAAAKRLDLYGKEGENLPAVAESDEINEEEIISSRKRKFPSKDIEVKTYADLSKHAMDFIVKKVPVVKATLPTSTRNISLRTGSSVGNKMKAAVATLTTNVGWISDTSSSSGIQTNAVPSNSSITPIRGETLNIVKGSSSDVNALNDRKEIQQNVSDSSGFLLHKTAINPDNAVSIAAMPPPMPHAGKKLNSGKQLKKKNLLSGKKRSGKMMRGVASVSSSELPSISNKPLHLIAKGVNSSDRDQGTTPSRVILPEAAQLRRKRRSLISKVDKLMNDAYSDLMTNGDIVNRVVSKDTKSDANHLKILNQKTMNRVYNLAFEPSNLPTKRKTQWDYVLEEMRWMATDFVEENKWKIAKARTLSAAVMAYHTKATIKLKRIKPHQLLQSTKHSFNNPPKKSLEKVIPKSEYIPDVHEEDLVTEFTFGDPTDEDKLFVRSVLGELNAMIKLFWECSSDKQCIHGKTIITSERNMNDDSALCSRRESSQQTKEIETTESRQLLFNDIEKDVKGIHEKAAAIKRSDIDVNEHMKAEIVSNLKWDHVGIHEKHIQSLLFIQSLWDDNAEPHITGSILTGPIGCGKTFFTCLLLWQRRFIGRHLVVCPGSSLLRWKCELEKFSNLQLEVIGDDDSSGNLSMNPSSQKGQCEVVLCEISLVSSYLSSIKKKQIFGTVIIDIRCTSFMQQIKDSYSPKNRADRSPLRSYLQHETAADELYSFEWWNQIIDTAICRNTKSVLIETSGVCDDFGFVEASHIQMKSRVDLIASKAAFLYHAVFQSKLKTYCRRALWWAKKYYSKSKNDSEPPGGVKGVLLQLLDSISCRVDSLNVNTEGTENTLPRWSLQTCPLSSEQREAYDRTCIFLSGTFHNCGKKSEQLRSYAKALLRLRRTCFHSKLHEFATSIGFRNCASSSPLKYSGSCSQPNLSAAKAFLNESSKLKQLLLILCNDCGFDVPAKGFLLDSKSLRRDKRISSLRKKKVLILATLPEVLLLISSFLNTIGIAHELLSTPSLPMAHSEKTESSVLFDDSIMFWSHFQNSIRQFDNKNCDGTQDKADFGPDVLITSPSLLGSSSLGMSAATAEVVISMDEHWSGSSKLSLFSIVEKNRINNILREDRKYIKLISEGTCEQIFMYSNEKCHDNTSVTPVTPRLIPGNNILRCVGFPLNEVLCSRVLPRTGLLGNSKTFLECLTVSLKNQDGLGIGVDNDSTMLCYRMHEDNDLASQKDINLFAAFVRTMVKFEMATSLFYCPSLFPARPRANPYCNLSGRLLMASQASKYTDTRVKRIQRYIMSVKPILSKVEAARTNVTNVPSQLQQRISITDKYEKLTKSDNVFISLSPEDISNSLIFYTCYANDSEHQDYANDFDVDDISSKRHRGNFYTRSFMNMEKYYDGNQGSESLVYFPPIFPGLIEARQGSEKDLGCLNHSFLRRDVSFIDGSKKRKGILDGYPGSSKKLRTPNSSTNLPDFSSSISGATPSQPLPQLPGEFNFIADDDFMDGAADFFDGEFLPDLNITKDEDISSDTQISEGVEVEDTTTFVFDEDFGLLGAGILPSKQESSKAATKYHGYSNNYSYWLDPFEPKSSVDDFRIRGPTLNSIVLHVRNSGKHDGGFLGRSLPNIVSKGISYDSAKGINAYNGTKNGSTDSLLQKKKKSAVNAPAVTAFVLPSALNIQKAKDGDSNPLPIILPPKDNSSAIDRTSNSPFKSFALSGLQTLRVHHDLQDIFDPSNNQMIGSRIQLFNNQLPLVSSHSAIRKLLPDENTGDSALSLSKKQSQSFCSDSGLSIGVDFGPFSVSVLPETMLKLQTDPLASINGITLPMGVKMPKTTGSGLFGNNIEDWSSFEDEMLKYYAFKFDYNWRIVSQSLAFHSGYYLCFDSETAVNPLRSAKQCNDRWQKLQGTPCTDDEENSDNHQMKFEVDSNLSLRSDEIFAKGLLLDVSMLQESEDLSRKVANEERNVASRLRMLRNAGAHRKVIPLTIPGYTAGENTPSLQIVQSHPSHSQSVQEAIANSARPSGIVPPRAEMWPLQFLDLTEKQLQEVEKKKMASAVAQVSRTSVATARNVHPQHPSTQSASSSRGPPRAGQPNAKSSQMLQSVQSQTQPAMARPQQHPMPSTQVPPPHLRQGLPVKEQNMGNGNNTGLTR